MINISIVIPAHNEEKRIERTLQNYLSYFKDLKKKKILDFEIVVVLNACTDNTLKIAEKLRYKELKILNFKESGKGFAVIKGFKEALNNPTKELIGFADADMATSPEAFYDLVENIGNYDVIIASRYVKGAIVSPKPTIKRIIASRIYNLLIRSIFLIPYKDTQCGAKIFKRDILEKIIPKIGMTKWAFDTDILYQIKKIKGKIKEYPTIWRDKEYSKINLRDAGPSMLLAIIRLRILNSPFKRMIKIYDIFPKYLKL